MESKKRQILQWSILGGILVIVVTVMLCVSFSRIKREGIQNYEDVMTSSASKYAQKVNMELSELQTAADVAADVLSTSSHYGQSLIKETLMAVQENTSAEKAVYYNGGNTGYVWDGTDFATADLEKEPYFGQLAGLSETKVFCMRNSEDLKTTELVIMAPSGENGKGSVLLYLPVRKLDKLFKISVDFGADAFALIIDKNGYIVTSGTYESDFLTELNFWNNFADKNRESVSKARVRLVNAMTGCIKASSRGTGEKRTVVYAPVLNSGFTVIIGVDQSYVDKKESNFWKSSGVMLTQLLLVLIGFFAAFLTISYTTRKNVAEHDRLLREEADTDLLTGLTNKLATERKIKEYIAENPNSLGMMFVLDIDNFKKINDTMGHAFGDEVLKTLGRTISSLFRVTDIIGRTGGDEFTIFLKFLKSDENTLKEARKLVQFFKDFTAGEYVKYSATASIGAAVFPENGSDFDSLYKAADKALYKAKQRGKNQLAFYDDRDRK